MCLVTKICCISFEIHVFYSDEKTKPLPDGQLTYGTYQFFLYNFNRIETINYYYY